MTDKHDDTPTTQDAEANVDADVQTPEPVGSDTAAEVAPVTAADVPLTEEQIMKIEDHPKGDDEYLMVPRGALAFVILLILFYVGYWTITWFEVFVLRGA